MVNKKTLVLFGTTVVLVAGISIFSFYRLEVSLKDVLAALQRFSLPVVSGALGYLLIHSFCLLMRFYFLLPRRNPLPLSVVTHAIGIGQIANNYLPGRAGDGLKILILSRNPKGQNLPLSVGTGVMLADKVVDLAAVVSVALFTRAYEVPGVQWIPSASTGALVGGTTFVAAVGYFVVRHLRKNPTGRTAVFLRNLAEGLGGTVRLRQVVPSYLVGLGVWIAEAMGLQTLCAAQGFVIPLGQAMLALIVLNALVAIPLTFANIGPYEASLAVGLAAIGIGSVPALAIATAHHCLQLVNVLILGAAGWSAKTLAFRLVDKKGLEETSPEIPPDIAVSK